MINIQGINTEVTEALREHVEHCAAKLDKFNTKNDLNLKVNLKVIKHDEFDVDVIVVGKSITGGTQGHDMYDCITIAFENVETMLARQKGKELSKRHEKIDLTDTEE
jgi:ribosomal subunit interface protein